MQRTFVVWTVLAFGWVQAALGQETFTGTVQTSKGTWMSPAAGCALTGNVLTCTNASTASPFAVLDLGTELTSQITVSNKSVSLPIGTYTIWDSSVGLAPDAGWSPSVGTYKSSGSGNSCQKWVWDGATLKALGEGSCAGITGSMVDTNGLAKLSSKGDKISIAASGTGWIIKDTTTGHFLARQGTAIGNPGATLFSPSILTVWTATK